MLKHEPITTSYWTLSDEGKSIVLSGSPEYQVFAAVPATGGVSLTLLQETLGDAVVKIGLGPFMKNKWLIKKGDSIERLVDSVVDETAVMLAKIADSGGDGIAEVELNTLKKRKLIQQVTRKSYRITKGGAYKPQRVRKHAHLTKEMLGARNEVNITHIRVDLPMY